MTKFKFQKGIATKKGPLRSTMIISKEHTLYEFLFDDEEKVYNPRLGTHRPRTRPMEEVTNLLDNADNYTQQLAKEIIGYKTIEERGNVNG